jgi:hypothetical protein
MAAVAGARREETESEDKRGKKEGRNSWRRWAAPGGSLVSRAQAGGGNGDVQEASTQELPVSAKKTRGFCKNPPWTLGFSGKFENGTLFALFGKSNLF